MTFSQFESGILLCVEGIDSVMRYVCQRVSGWTDTDGQTFTKIRKHSREGGKDTELLSVCCEYVSVLAPHLRLSPEAQRLTDAELVCTPTTVSTRRV